MKKYFRVEVLASRHNRVTSCGNGGVFHTRQSADEHKDDLIKNREALACDIWITTLVE